MTDSCRVLLLKLSLSKQMKPNGIVSIPRAQLAKELGVAPARISERIKLARRLGFLDIVRRARPDVTAVYQALIPTSEVRQPYPKEVQNPYPSEVRQTGHVHEVRQPYPIEPFRGTPSPHPRRSTQLNGSQTPDLVESETLAATRAERTA